MEVWLGFSPEAGLWYKLASAGPSSGEDVPTQGPTTSLFEPQLSAESGPVLIGTKEALVLEEIAADLPQVPNTRLVEERVATLPWVPATGPTEESEGAQGAKSRGWTSYPSPGKLLNYEHSFFVLEVSL